MIRPRHFYIGIAIGFVAAAIALSIWATQADAYARWKYQAGLVAHLRHAYPVQTRFAASCGREHYLFGSPFRVCVGRRWFVYWQHARYTVSYVPYRGRHILRFSRTTRWWRGW